jgi:hypothetical protein
MSSRAPQYTSNRIALVRGPSADRLIDAFKYVYDEGVNVPIVFYDEHGHTFRVDVRALEHEDGSGQSIAFSGGLVWTELDLPFSGKYVAGLWHGGSRHGFLDISDRRLPLSGSGC